MDYNKLWNLINMKNLSKSAAGRVAGLSPQGFISMMEKKTMTIATLEKFSKYFEKPVSYFFDGQAEFDDDTTSPIYDTCKDPRCRDKTASLEARVLELMDDKNLLKSLLKELQEKGAAVPPKNKPKGGVVKFTKSA